MNRLVSSLVTCCAICGLRDGVGHIEGRDLVALVAHQVDVDVLAHPLHLLVGRTLRVVTGVKVVLVDDVQQPGAAENLLRDALHPLLQIVVDVGRDVIFRHGGLFHQNQRARLVARRQHPARAPHRRAQPRNSGIRKCRWRRRTMPR